MKTAKQIRQDILRYAMSSGHGHIPSCFSIVEILMAVYQTKADDDVFILSKGHAALAHYCVLGLEPYDMGNYGSKFGCHADRLKIPEVNVSTGSLGHGIGVAVGMALGFRIQGKKNRVICLIGDGEANEGSVWEAVMVAVNLELHNLTIIVDANHSHEHGLQLEDIDDIFEAFGCDRIDIHSPGGNGNNIGDMVYAIQKSNDNNDDVKIIVANTTKGYPCPTLMSDPKAWHRRAPTEAEYQMLLKELDENSI